MSPHNTWYVEPLDAHSNEVISRALSTENAASSLPCADGKNRNLWFCDYVFAKKINEDQSQLKVKVHIWRQKGKGQIERAPNFSKFKKRAAKKKKS